MIALQSGPDTLHPHRFASSRSEALLGQWLCLSLLSSDPESGQLRPRLAAELPQVESATCRWLLRSGVRWDDGRPLTAADYVRSIDSARSDERTAGKMRSILGLVRSASAEGPRRLALEMKRIDHEAIELIGRSLFPMHPDGMAEDHARGCGPYRLAASDQTGLRLTRKQEWWGDTVPEYSGWYRFDEVLYRWVADQSAQLRLLHAGEIDLCGLSPRLAEAVDDAKASLDQFELQGFSFVGWNCADALLRDPLVRRALSLLIPRARIADAGFDGRARPIDSPWGDELDIPPRPAALARARSLLAEAGFADGDGDGILDRAGEDLQLRLLAPAGEIQWVEVVARNMVESLRQAGVVLQVDRQSLQSMLATLRERRHQAVLLMWNPTSSVTTLRALLHSAERGEGGRNFQGYASADADRIMDSLATCREPQRRDALLRQWHERLLADQPITVLFRHQSILAWRPQVVEPMVGRRGVFWPGCAPVRSSTRTGR